MRLTFFNKITVATINLLLVSGYISYSQNPVPLPSVYSSGMKPSFVRCWEATAPETNQATLVTKGLREVKQSTIYYDGAGRTLQTVVKKGSLITNGNNLDLISPAIFDPAGREQYKYLSFASTASDGTQLNGLLKLNPFQQQVSFYNNYLAGQANETGVGPSSLNWAYNQVKFEESPLNRSEEIFSPGSSWIGTSYQALEANRRSVKIKNWKNTTTDAVRLWTVTDPASIGSFGTYASTAYAVDLLFKSVIVDELGKQVIEFKDKSGNLILKKVQVTAAADNGTGSGHTGWLCTYYIYDNFGNLRCTVTPRGVELISSNWLLDNVDVLAEQCYRYEYDERNRMIMKKVPGAGEEYVVYDNKGRLVMTQDANLRNGTPKKWLITLYDNLDRTLQTGLWDEANSLSYHVTAAKNSAVTNYPFSETTIPGSGFERLTRIAYDRYSSFPAGTGITTAFDNTYTANSNYFYTTYNASPDFVQPFTLTTQTRGLVTWTETKVLKSSPAKYLYTLNFYDDKGRLIQVKKKNITDGIDIATAQYNWNGQKVRILEKQEKAGTPVQTSLVVTMISYDDLGRITQLDKKIQNTLVNANALPAAWTSVVKNEYDALGQLKLKKVGGKKDPITGSYTGVPLETMSFEYNVRGWLLGMNRSYTATQGQSGTSLFGYELGYDKLTNLAGQNFINTAQLNGSATGMVWKSDGDDTRRKYDFKYDEAYRLLKATFIQQNADDNLWNTAQINYTVQMGDGNTAASAYDANGNIKAMTQYGYKPGGTPSTPIDQLTYNYMFNNTSNRLLNVIDANNLPDTKLGDFRTSLLHMQVKTTATVDYIYDNNGNMVKDFNKDIVAFNSNNGITYNHLELTEVATIKKDATANKGTITYTYDANGIKLKKEVKEFGVQITHGGTSYNTDVTTTSTYISGFIYETKFYLNGTLNTALGYTDRLQLFKHEEGRTRLKVLNGVLSLHYDYFITDHLGNIRMVLTEEAGPASIYEATLELALRADELQLFTQITETESLKPAGFDNLPPASNDKVSKLFNITGSDKRVGVGVVLKVMAGDKFKAQTFGWYLPGATNVAPLAGAGSILNNILAAFTGGVPVGSKYSGTELNGSGVLNAPVNAFLTYQNGLINTARPRAFLNWMILDDEQFKLVAGSYGAVQVPEITGVMQKQVMQAASGGEINVTRNGYLYVYVSNESQGNVYFDNIRVEHTRGSLTEETHYYPAGMQMAGIGSQALNSTLVANDFKYQGQEYENGLGLNMLEFEARMYDQQLGRWHVQDPASQFASPYLGMGNNWPNGRDPDGRIFGIDDILIGALIGAAISAVTTAATTFIAGGTWKDIRWGRALATGALGGAIGAGFSGMASSLGAFGQSVGYGIMSNVATHLAVDIALGNRITLGSVIGSAIGGALDGAIPQFKGFKHSGKFNFGHALRNGLAELGINTARGGVIGAFSGGLGAAIDGQDVGEGISNGFRSGAIGAGVRTSINLVILGAPIRPNGKVRAAIEQMQKDKKVNLLNGPGSPVYRTGGLWQRGLTTGRSLVVGADTESDNAVAVWIEESYHYYQQILQTWATQAGKGMKEQWWMNFINGDDPYITPGTNEYEAFNFARGYRTRFSTWKK